MAGRRQQALLTLLVDEPGWHTAARLADRLQVTPRTVRSYVTSLNEQLPGTPVVASGPDGYKILPDGVAGLRRSTRQAAPEPRGGRRDRLHRLVRALLESDLDLFDVAQRLHVSEATVEADLARVRTLVKEVGELELTRNGPTLRLSGPELARRRLLTTLVQDELSETTFDLTRLADAAGEDTVAPTDLARFRDELALELTGMGFFVNEFAIADLSLQVAITVGRVRRGKPLGSFAAVGAPQAGDEPQGEELRRLAAVVGHLASTTLGTELGPGDRDYLASVIRTRVVVPDTARRPASVPGNVDLAVRAAAARVGSEYGVDLSGEGFLTRLSLHVQNLVQRSREGAIARNPLTRSLKSTYPMIFEVAVALVGELGQRLGLHVGDDEIAYVTMHVGGELERDRTREARLSATIVCPGYYELHELLTSSVTRSLGDHLEITEVVTRIDPDWASLTTDLVLTTIDPPEPSSRLVRIRPFLTEADIDRVNAAASRLRRERRLTRLRTELRRYVDQDAFVAGLDDQGPEQVIRQLGGLLVQRGIIDEAHVDEAIAREAMSSTAFTESLAVPHAMSMSASHTALAIGLAPSGIGWGPQRVQVVVFAAFSESDREAFQTIFEQFVAAFSSPEQVQQVVKRATNLSAFLDEVTTLIEA